MKKICAIRFFLRIFVNRFTHTTMTEQFVIQSNIALLPSVEERLFHFCHLCHVGNYYSAVSVATLQAVENAIVHGNGADPTKSVSLTMGTCHGGLFVEVADQGAGFDYDAFGDLPAEGQVAGEGIFVMRQLADKLIFADGGRKVRLEFAVAGIDPADAMERVAVLRNHWATVAA